MNVPFAMNLHPLLRGFRALVLGTALAACTVLGTAHAAAPVISVEQPAGTALTDDAPTPVNFGGVLVNASGSAVTFKIKNTGDARLTGLVLSKTGSHPNDFDHSALSTTSLDVPGGTTNSTTFTVTFKPSAAGARTATLRIGSNDPNTDYFDIRLSGTGQAPEIVVEQPAGTEVADGATHPFTGVAVNASGSPVTFTIKNTGNAPLTGLALSKTGDHTGDFDVSTLTTTSLTAAGGATTSTTFTVTFKPTAIGTRKAALKITSNDADEQTYDIKLEGTGQAPEILMLGEGSTNIANGGRQAFGTLLIGSSKRITFTIQNEGNVDLTGVSATVVGANPADFVIGPQPSATVAAGGYATFYVVFTPTAANSREATLRIFSNDADENPYDIALAGGASTLPDGKDRFEYRLSPTPVSSIELNTASSDVVELDLNGNDEFKAINIGFDFMFYDKAYSSCAVSTNGLLTFEGGSNKFDPAGLPSTDLPNAFIAPFWTDLVVQGGTAAGSSKVLYTTRGVAPNRMFIIEYRDLREYENDSARVTVQVFLHEGSNAIEFQYKKLDNVKTTRNVVIGIENRDGTDGIRYEPGPPSTIVGEQTRPTVPSAVVFRRPVVVDVSSKYLRPGSIVDAFDIGTTAVGLNPGIGSKPFPYNTPARFEAPEFIYLDRNFGLLTAAGDVPRYDKDGKPIDPGSVAWYRLVNDGYSVDGQVVQGTRTFFSTTLTRDIKLVWRWRLEFAAIIEPGRADGGSVNNQGRQWLSPGDQFAAIIDSPLEGLNDSSGMRYAVTGYSLYKSDNTQIGAAIPVTAGAYVSSNPLSMTAPVRLRWNWVAQVRYRFDARSGGLDNTLLPDQAFIRTYDHAGTFLETHYASVPDTTVWVNRGTKVEVGTFYRTRDRRLTLTDFQAPPSGDLSPLGRGVASLPDTEVVPEKSPGSATRVSRFFTVASAGGPTDIHWLYAPTVFRAEVPIGRSFDPKSPDFQLVPDLAAGGSLKVSGDGPGGTFEPKLYPPEGSTLNGQPLRWDGLSKELFPVHPGSYRINWPDATGSGETYLVEVVTAFPNDTAALTSPRESDNGRREILSASPLVYRTSTPPFSGVSTDFPAAPAAHYRHLFDPLAARQPPTRLDISTSDAWAFKEMPFADRGMRAVADATAAGVPFTASGPGRTVMLYSYRPNPDEAADGDPTQEGLSVRVVQSSQLQVTGRDHPALVLGRRSLQLGAGTGSRGAYGVVQSATPPVTTADPGSQFVADFWLRTKDLEEPLPVSLVGCSTVAGSRTVVCTSTASVLKGMGVSGRNIPTGAKIAAVDVNGTTLQLDVAATATASGLTLSATNKPVTVVTTANGHFTITLDAANHSATAQYRGIKVTQPLPRTGASWHHFAAHVFSGRIHQVEVAVLEFHLDGTRRQSGAVIDPSLSGAPFDIAALVADGSLRFGVDAEIRSGLLLDNFRLFALEDDELGWLSPGEVRLLRNTRDMNAEGSRLRSERPMLSFDFEDTPLSGRFANSGSLARVALGGVPAAGSTDAQWALADIQEVATRIESTLDNAGFSGTGYVLNEVSNYNANFYQRSAPVGTWGPVFPVNHYRHFSDPSKRLEIAYYENPHLNDRLLHPNVAWPYIATDYQDVVFPAKGPHRSKAIYIASRIGSEGVDRNGMSQRVYDPSAYGNLAVYQQPALTQPGYNPNEEHALIAPSGRSALRVRHQGEAGSNNPPPAAFALRCDTGALSATASSEPWVLVQYDNLATGEPEMAAYQVFRTRPGSVDFPRPTASSVAASGGALTYEQAANPDNAFLLIDSSRATDFSYQFEYPAYAGDLVVAPYPLNLVIGNARMADARGNSLQVRGTNQRALWHDVNGNAWVVSGNGAFAYQFFYPMRSDFHLANTAPGTPVAWLATDNIHTGNGASLNPVRVTYNTRWRSDYPKLKRGETLAYPGGEYFSENPGAKGLPSLVAMAAAEIVYDSATPSMSIGAPALGRYGTSECSARIIRPLDRREESFTTAAMAAAGFSPAATSKIFAVGERWYFKALPGSLQKRFYYDSLATKLVFRGRLNGKESGDANLTVGPDPVNLLEPNVMTAEEHARVRALSTVTAWTDLVDRLYVQSQNPHKTSGGNLTADQPPLQLQGFKNSSDPGGPLYNFLVRLVNFFSPASSPEPALEHLDSFGTGAALVPSPGLLTRPAQGPVYVTVAENNRTELAGAPVSLHIIEIVPDRFRGAIQVIEGADAFSEKVTLQHNGDFGANTDDLYYEWWIRDAAPLDVVAGEILADGTLKQVSSGGQTLWQEYIPQSRAGATDDLARHRGLHSVVFEGRPDVVLADKLVLMRYRHRNESQWRLVPFEFANASTAWAPGSANATPAAPFQWAGAANSPQLQADGSKRYIPQLIMGWVKRVLDRINPYEARYADFFTNESPATYSSQIQIAGAPYAGKVALNPAKSVIENTGLIELYRTVLDRARELSIDNPNSGPATDGINQALLLAATRLSVLYELLGAEAYSDAQDSTINAGEDGSLAGVASYTHAFQNMEADLLHEELALLRGTDFGKSYPVHNRLFWNYAKGLGEAAYNVNYHIYDANLDGFVNEDDARKLYPQGHGDSWGHYVCAIDMHYALLQHPGFSWKTRSELYSLMQNVLEVDYLDEKTFARLAAGRARAGRDIVRGTYRLHYTQNPDGQWQGYTDGADPARAWGVSEWARRTGQASHFDWAVANALLPEDAADATPVTNPENLDRIERSGAIAEIGAIAGGLHEIQVAMDEANSGFNPLGLDSDALTFDIELDFYINNSGGDRRSHYEQIHTRAVTAGMNAVKTLEIATQADNKLKAIAADTDGLIREAMAQDLDYRNRLIAIYGRPYTGTIGTGQAYPEGYEGPDTQLYAYLDKTRIDQYVPPKTAPANSTGTVTFDGITRAVIGIMNKPAMKDLYEGVWIDKDTAKGREFAEWFFSRFGINIEWQGEDTNRRRAAFETLIGSNQYLFEPIDPDGSGPLKAPGFTAPYNAVSKYAFEAPAAWGRRTAHGTLQASLQDMLAAEIELDSALADYTAYLGDLENKLRRIDSQLALFELKTKNHEKIRVARRNLNIELITLNTIFSILKSASEAASGAANGVKDGLPVTLGFSNDFTSFGRGIASVVSTVATFVRDNAELLKDLNESIATAVEEAYEFEIELHNNQIDQISELEGMVEDYQAMTGAEQVKRNAIGAALQSLETHRQAYVSAQAEGNRLLREREAFNKALAAAVQKNRYQDMVFRLSRNEALAKYQTAYNHAARYTWLAAKAYDYETSLEPGHPAAPGALLDDIVRERQLGAWSDGEPQSGHGGLAEILTRLKGNFDVIKGQFGINNPQLQSEKISLRSELFRIHSVDPTPASDDRWKDVLKARIVPDLNKMPEFLQHCRPVGPGVQPGMVIRFGTAIEPGRNFFGLPLMSGDHQYSTANYATKIYGLGVWLDGYNEAGLSATPRAFLVPIGQDHLRTSTATHPLVRAWNVVEQRVPIPHVLSPSTLASSSYIPTLDGTNGSFGELRRHGDFRIYHNNGDPEADDSELIMDTRLISRSVWNSQWMLVIPGSGLAADPAEGLRRLADHVSDIKLYFQTTSHQGQ